MGLSFVWGGRMVLGGVGLGVCGFVGFVDFGVLWVLVFGGFGI